MGNLLKIYENYSRGAGGKYTNDHKCYFSSHQILQKRHNSTLCELLDDIIKKRIKAEPLHTFFLGVVILEAI